MKLLSAWTFKRSYGEVMRGFGAGCPFCDIVHSAANRAISGEKLLHSAFLVYRVTVSGSHDSEHDLDTEIQRKEAGQKTDAGKLSNDLSSMNIPVPKVRRGMTLFYSPIENAQSWQWEEFGRIEMSALEGILTNINLAFQNTINDSCFRRPCFFLSFY